VTRAGCWLLRWMLKRVPGWGGEWGRWPCRPLDGTAENVSCRRSRSHTRRAACIDRRGCRPDLRTSAALVRHGRHRTGTRTVTRPESRSPPDTETRFSIPGRTVPARSRQPHSDNLRSRNPRIARKPKRNTPYGQENPQSNPMPDTKPPDPSDQHRQKLPPVKRTFGYFCCNRQKSLASASAAGGEKTFEVEVEVEIECKSRAHPARVPCCIAQSTMLGFVQRTTERKSTTIARRQAK